jgi:hypothetical protein
MKTDDYTMALMKYAHSGEFGRLFRLKSATCSGPNRPPVPIDFGHRSRRRRIDGLGFFTV